MPYMVTFSWVCARPPEVSSAAYWVGSAGSVPCVPRCPLRELKGLLPGQAFPFPHHGLVRKPRGLGPRPCEANPVEKQRGCWRGEPKKKSSSSLMTDKIELFNVVVYNI